MTYRPTCDCMMMMMMMMARMCESADVHGRTVFLRSSHQVQVVIQSTLGQALSTWRHRLLSHCRQLRQINVCLRIWSFRHFHVHFHLRNLINLDKTWQLYGGSEKERPIEYSACTLQWLRLACIYDGSFWSLSLYRVSPTSSWACESLCTWIYQSQPLKKKQQNCVFWMPFLPRDASVRL